MYIYILYIYMWNHQPAMAAMLRRAVDFFDQATWNSSGNQLEPLRPQPAFLNSQVSCWLCYPCCFDSTWLTNNSHFLDLVTKIQWVVFCQVFSCFLLIMFDGWFALSYSHDHIYSLYTIYICFVPLPLFRYPWVSVTYFVSHHVSSFVHGLNTCFIG